MIAKNPNALPPGQSNRSNPCPIPRPRPLPRPTGLTLIGAEHLEMSASLEIF